ncbi:MAG TPA: TonB-dependent receptor plug domain-containing protein, partial [Usitatibacter sp.]|nr:TonB-dependent receptor plug domain-containing protein [Usitatibacter sp.]
MNKIKAVALAVAAAFPCAAFATGPESPEWFERIVIVAASRVEEPLESSPSPVTVIERREIRENVATDLRALLRYEPGVSVESAPARFGFGNINIRGLDGNRVLMTIDGIRLPEGYRVGSFSNASRNLFGLGLLQQVEILRGPTSAIHGSDALAGVFAVTTVSPPAYLRDGRTSGGEVFAQYAQADESFGGGAVVAARAGPTQLLVGLESVDGREMMNKGDVGGTGAARTEPNPQDTHAESQLIKWVVPAGDRWQWTLTGERY